MLRTIDWSKALTPLLKKYKGSTHPLEYQNTYQLLVMVVLAGQSTDKLINQVAPAFFRLHPNLKSLAATSPPELHSLLKRVRNFANKSEWLVQIAQLLKKDSNIPLTMEKLVELPGIGRKSANVILREAGAPAEGVMVDIHVVRVAPRLGIVSSIEPKKIETELMNILPKNKWDAGMALSFHGREICRPKPLCEICDIRNVCKYYHEVITNL